MNQIEELMKQLPPDLQQEVVDFAQSLVEKQTQKPKRKLTLAWRGALSDLRGQYTSVELQHKALEWWGD
jgi:hypothetical protein